MVRARRPLMSAVVLVVALAALVRFAPATVVSIRPAAAVGWPASTGLVVAEVVTGSTSASDEYVEIANAGPDPLDLNGLELVYAAAAGTTATRKAAWSATQLLDSGRHLLLANGSGAFAGSADATFSGGIAATGGSVAIRVVGGAVIDAVGWGDATNAFVEGGPAVAPAAGASIERRPGGSAGNAVDTNENAVDWVAQAVPVPQNLAWVPSPGPSPSPTASPAPTSPPDQSAGATATPAPTAPPSASPGPSVTPGPTPIASESPAVTPGESPVPTESAPPQGSASPSPSNGPGASGPVDASPTTSPEESPPPTPEPEPPVDPTSPPAPSASPRATPVPAATTGPTDSPAPSQSAVVVGTPGPSDVATPSPTASAGASPSPTPSATATPPPSPIAIASARAASDGATVVVQGILTTALGAIDTDRGAFIQDSSGGIALYLDDDVTAPLPRAIRVRVTGTIGQRYSQLVLRVAPADIVDLGPDILPNAEAIPTGSATEPNEGRRVVIEGEVTGSPSQVAGGFSVTIDDGSGQARAITATVPAGLVAGVRVRAVGPLGQHDSTGSGTSGYRVYALEPGDLAVLQPAATPSPTPTPTSTPTVSQSPSPTPTSTPSPSPSPMASPTPSATPSPSPSPSPAPTSAAAPVQIAAARGLAVGASIRIAGIVTAEADRLGSEGSLMLQDGTAGIVVRLPDGQAGPARGTRLEVLGVLAAPYGQLEIRPASGGWQALGSDVVPDPIVIIGALDESLEGLLAVVEGVVAASPATSSAGDVSLELIEASGIRIRVQADVTSAITASRLQRGRRYRVTGVVGQRATATGRLDGYRMWLRDPDDIAVVGEPAPSATAAASSASSSPSMSAGQSATPPRSIRINAAILAGGHVVVEGIVTAGSGLLDSGGQTVVIQDASGAIAVRLPTAFGPVKAGRRIRVEGESGSSYGAPRVLAASVTDLGAAPLPSPLALAGEPSADQEWRLVRVVGVVRSVHRDGAQWRAEIGPEGPGARRVDGLAGARIPVDRLAVGGTATIVGVVRRPYPTATDRRFSVLPRSSVDISIAAAPAAVPSRPGGTSRAASTTAGQPGGASSQGGTAPPDAIALPGDGSTSSVPGAAQTLDVDLVDLAHAIGLRVRVGGIIVGTTTDGLVLDDGTARAAVHFAGDAGELRDRLVIGLAVNLVGAVVGGPEPSLSVTTADDVVTLGDPGAPAVVASPSESGPNAAGLLLPGDGSGSASPEDSTLDGEAGTGGGTGLVIALLLSLAVVGVVALALGRRRPGGPMMAHPERPQQP